MKKYQVVTSVIYNKRVLEPGETVELPANIAELLKNHIQDQPEKPKKKAK